MSNPQMAAEAGFSPERLARLDAAMLSQIDDGRYAGISLMVARHGRVIHDARYGYQDLAARTPLAADAIFRVGSMTKPLIGAGLMVLYEDGLWQLDDPLAKFIPEFADLRVATEEGTEPAAHLITMRELLTSSAGFASGLPGEHVVSAVDRAYLEARFLAGTNAEMLTSLSRIPLESQPGTKFRYGVQHDIQGALIERMSGQPLDVFLERRLFAPLDMPDTGFEVPELKRARIAPVYGYDEQLNLVLAERQGLFSSVPGKKPRLLSGGGGIYSTMRDYMRFSLMIANGGGFDGRRILAPSTVALMGRDLLPAGVPVEFEQKFEAVGYGAGFAIVLDPARATHNNGPFGAGTMFWGGSYGTWFWIDPVNDVVVLGMSQLLTAAAAYVGMATHAPDLRAISRSLTYQALIDPTR